MNNKKSENFLLFIIESENMWKHIFGRNNLPSAMIDSIIFILKFELSYRTFIKILTFVHMEKTIIFLRA